MSNITKVLRGIVFVIMLFKNLYFFMYAFIQYIKYAIGYYIRIFLYIIILFLY